MCKKTTDSGSAFSALIIPSIASPSAFPECASSPAWVILRPWFLTALSQEIALRISDCHILRNRHKERTSIVSAKGRLSRRAQSFECSFRISLSAFLALRSIGGRSLREGALLLDLIAPTGAFRSRDENSAVSLAIVERGARGGSRRPRWAEEARGEGLELLKEGCWDIHTITDRSS